MWPWFAMLLGVAAVWVSLKGPAPPPTQRWVPAPSFVALETAPHEGGPWAGRKAGTTTLARGQVVATDGSPVPNATIVCTHGDGRTTQHVADAFGGFELESPTDEIEINASAPGFHESDTIVELPTEPIRIELSRSLELAGVVVRDDSGEPVANALVLAQISGEASDEESFVRTDAAGRFLIGGLHEGHYTPHARARGLYGVASRVTLAEGANSPPVTIRMRGAANLRMQLVFDDGEPCDDGSALLESSIFGAFEASTDIDGWAAFEGLPPGKYAVRLSCSEHVNRQDEAPLRLAEGDDTAMVFVLREGLVLSGIVVNSRGEPLEDHCVMATAPNLDEDPAAFSVSYSDEAGRFTLIGLAATTYTLSTHTASGEPEMTVTLSEHTPAPDVRLVDDPMTLRGRIVDGEGLGVANASLSGIMDSGQELGFSSGDDGRFEIDSILAGTMTVAAQLDGESLRFRDGPPIVHVPQDGDVKLVALAPSRKLQGLVRDSNGPRPRVLVSAIPRGLAFGSQEVLTDRDGRFTLHHVRCDDGCTVTAKAFTGESASVEANASSESVNLVLRPPARLEGLVLDAPSSFSIMVTGEELQSQSFQYTKGAWNLPGLPPGEYEVLAETDDSYGKVSVKLEAGETRRLTISLKPGSIDDENY